MDIATMIEAATHEFKQKLSQQCKDLDLERLTPPLAEQISQGLKQALSSAGVAGFRTFLQGYDETTPTLAMDGGLYRWKRARPKRFLTPFGEMVLEAICINRTGEDPPTCRWIANGAWKGSLRP